MSAPPSALATLLNEDPQAADALWRSLTPGERGEAGALALHAGRPRLALAWAPEPLVRAAALLRLGEAEAALRALTGLPSLARPAVVQARALHQLAAPDATAAANAARALARAEGDSGAFVAAVTLLAERELLTGAPPHAPLRTLAEGLKVAELSAQAADAHLLAVLACAQARLNPRKAAQTAEKALLRSEPRSPARVLALRALGRHPEADAQAQAGELAPVWWAISPGQTAAS